MSALPFSAVLLLAITGCHATTTTMMTSSLFTPSPSTASFNVSMASTFEQTTSLTATPSTSMVNTSSPPTASTLTPMMTTTATPSTTSTPTATTTPTATATPTATTTPTATATPTATTTPTATATPAATTTPTATTTPASTAMTSTTVTPTGTATTAATTTPTATGSPTNPPSTNQGQPTTANAGPPPTSEPIPEYAERRLAFQLTLPGDQSALVAACNSDKESAKQELGDQMNNLINIPAVEEITCMDCRSGSFIADFTMKVDRNYAGSIANIESDMETGVGGSTIQLQVMGQQADFPTSSLSVSEFDECLTQHVENYCSPNANCTNLPDTFSYKCECNDGYEGNGKMCEKKEEDSSILAVVLGVIFGIIFVAVIVIIVIKACKSKSKLRSISPQENC